MDLIKERAQMEADSHWEEDFIAELGKRTAATKAETAKESEEETK